MTKIGVILGSTRPGRRGDQVARWVMDQALDVLRGEVIAWSEALAPLRQIPHAA